MIDIFAALSLVTAAAKDNNDPQLFSDAALIYSDYLDLKNKKTDIAQLNASGKLKPLIKAIARVSNVGNSLVDDPQQMKNITDLLQSIG